MNADDTAYVARLATELREHHPEALDAAQDDLSVISADLAIDHTHPAITPEKPHG